ncbi:sigma factor [Streptomyces sp. NRRL F-5727]|uniref:RNA polymerase sigma factor n=1 Tax=Streptomyces sp. NRRL F-5727 TaxID=1463871 RepID=UPI00099CB368
MRRHWYPHVLRWVRHRCVDVHDAEDVAPHGFTQVWLHSHRYCPRRGNLGPWPYGITAHEIARRLGLPIGTVESHARRALKSPASAATERG